MRILLLGRTGQVGWELNRSLIPLGEVVAPSRADADFSSPESLRQIVRAVDAEVIVNAVAYTAVDKAETDEPLANLINADAPAVLAEEAIRSNGLLVHYSTDYVFDGLKTSPYSEEDTPNPINAYGRSKLAGDLNIQASGCQYIIFRTSWLYSSRGQNFVETILRLAEQHDELRIVSDQIGAPTSARFIADVTANVLTKIRPRSRLSACEVGEIYHLTSSNYTSWHGFAEMVFSACNYSLLNARMPPRLISIPSEQSRLRAPRPKNSRLSCEKIVREFGVNLPNWERCVRLLFDELASSNASIENYAAGLR